MKRARGIARALFHEYGLSPDDMERDFPVPVEASSGKLRRKRVEIAIFDHDQAHTIEHLRRIVICRPEPKNGHCSVTKLRDHRQARKVAALWSAGTDLALQPAAAALDDTHARVVLAEPSPPGALEEPLEAVLSRLDRPFGRRAGDLACVLEASARELLGRPLTGVHARHHREQGRVVVELALAHP